LNEPVTVQQFAPDGRRIVTFDPDGRARVWDIATGRPGALAQGGATNSVPVPTKQPTYSGAFSPDGKRIITAPKDRVAQVWDAATGRLLLPKYEPGTPDNMPVVGPDNFLRLQKQIDALEKRISELEKKLSERK